MTHPLVNRTSPKGQPFIGTCASCGKTGLTFRELNEPCDNPQEITQEQALIKAIEGESTK